MKLGVPFLVHTALLYDGWVPRDHIIWVKTNPQAFSGTDRLQTTYEFIYRFTKSDRYYFNLDAIRRPHKQSTRERKRRGRGETRPSLVKAYDGHPPGMHKPRPNQNKAGPGPQRKWDISPRTDSVEGGKPFMDRWEITDLHPLGANPGDVWVFPTFQGSDILGVSKPPFA